MSNIIGGDMFAQFLGQGKTNNYAIAKSESSSGNIINQTFEGGLKKTNVG